MKSRTVLFLAVAIAGAAPLEAASGREISLEDRDAVDRLVRTQVGSGRSADDQPVAEIPKARLYAVGSGSETTTYVAAQYTIETGNSWQLYMVVLDGATHTVLARGRIGGKGYRDATLEAVRQGVIVVRLKYYGESDAMCCPSVLGEAYFEVRDGELWEADARVKCGVAKNP